MMECDAAAVADVQRLYTEMHAVAKMDAGSTDPTALATILVRLCSGVTTPASMTSPPDPASVSGATLTHTTAVLTAEVPIAVGYQELRLKGNTIFRRGEHVDAAVVYGKALVAACQARQGQDGCLQWHDSDDGSNARRPAGPAPASTTHDIATILLNRATALLRAGQLEDALADATASTRLESANPKAWLRRGQCVLALLQGDGLHAHRAAVRRADHLDVDTVTHCCAKAIEAAGSGAPSKVVQSSVETLKTDLGHLQRCALRSPPSAAAAVVGPSRPVPTGLSDAVSETVRPGRGRCLVANRSIDVGTEVIEELPTAVVVSDDRLRTRCHQCFNPLPLSFRPCFDCGQSVYCSEGCAVEAEPVHRACECGVPTMSSEVRLAVRLAHSPPMWSGELVSNLHALDPDAVARCVCAAVQTVAVLSARPPRDGVRVWSLGDAAAVLVWIARVRMNTVAVTAYRRDAAGILGQFRVARGLFRATAAINHTCDPTVQLSFRGTTLVGRCRRRLENRDELSISYGPTAAFVATETRRCSLREQYCFRCACPPCRHAQSQPSAVQVPPAVSAALVQIERFRQTTPRLDPKQLRALLSAGDTIREHSSGGRVAPETFAAFDTIAQAAAQCDQLQIAAAWLTRAVAALEQAAGANDIAVGFEHIKLAECLLAVGEARRATESMQRASDIINTNIGTDSGVVTDALATLAGAVGLAPPPGSQARS
jgi:hypothetical protein